MLGDGLAIFPLSSWLRYAFETSPPVSASTRLSEYPQSSRAFLDRGQDSGQQDWGHLFPWSDCFSVRGIFGGYHCVLSLSSVLSYA